MANFFKSQQTHLVFGVLIFSSSIFLLISFYSFFQHWKKDQSILEDLGDRTANASNVLGKLGASIAHFFVYDGFGAATFLFPILLFFTGLYIILNIPVRQLRKPWMNGLLIMVWLSLALAHFRPDQELLGGRVGFEINEFMQIYMGRVGVFLLLLLTMLVFLIVRFKITPQRIKSWMPKPREKKDLPVPVDEDVTEDGFITGTAYENTEDEIELEFDSFETVTGQKVAQEAPSTDDVA